MKKTKWSFLFYLLILTATGCDEKNEPQPPTREEMLASGTWKFQSATYAGTDVSTNPQLACFIDNTLTFTTANTYTVTEGTVICSPSTAGSGTWSFKGSDSLQLSTALVAGGSGAFKINTLTSSSLVLQQNAMLVPPTPQPFVVTFKH